MQRLLMLVILLLFSFNIFAETQCLGLIKDILAAQREERSLIIIKPDAVRHHNIKAIINRFKDNGFSIVVRKRMKLDEGMARIHYEEHVDKPFFPSLLEFVTSGDAIVFVVEKKNAIKDARKLIGDIETPGTIRGDFATDKTVNAIHGSDSVEASKREIGNFFEKEAEFERLFLD